MCCKRFCDLYWVFNSFYFRIMICLFVCFFVFLDGEFGEYWILFIFIFFEIAFNRMGISMKKKIVNDID